MRIRRLNWCHQLHRVPSSAQCSTRSAPVQGQERSEGYRVRTYVRARTLQYLIVDFLPVSRQDLVTWLQQQIAEQKRIDATTSGVAASSDLAQSAILSKELPTSSDVQLILPGDAKKQRKQTKQIFLDRGELHGRVH
jgi:hypothetical protein